MKNVVNTSTEAGSGRDTDVATDADDHDDTGRVDETGADAGSGGDTGFVTDTDTNADGDTDTATEVGTDTNPCVDTDSGADTGPAVTQCTHKYGDFGGNERKAVGTVGTWDNENRVVVDVWETTPDSTNSVWSYLEIEMWDPRLGTADLTINKSIFDLDNYVIFATDCVEVNKQEVCDKEFLATRGTLTVTELNPGQPWDGNLAFTITNVKMEEMVVDWEAETFTWVENGETVCVDSWSYDGPVSRGAH